MVLLVLLLGAVLSIIHYYSEAYSWKIEKFHYQLVSFSAGLFITQIFLFFLPEFFRGSNVLGEKIFVLLLIGFVAFHAAEKYVYQHVKNKDELMKDLGEIHAAGFFADHFIVGVALYFGFQTGNVLFGAAIFLPFLMHTISSSISLTHIDNYFGQSKAVNVALSVSPLLGVISAALLNPDKLIYHAVFSLVIGGLLYVSIRDMLPEEKEGRFEFFILGVGISLVIYCATAFITTI